MISACSEQNQISKCKGTDYSKWTNCFGKEKMTNGVYEGQYLNGKFHGQGTATWANGNKYVGGFKNGKEHGQGTLTWSDGEKYVGEFKDGNYHGQGTYTYADGIVEKGIFKDGKFIKSD